MITSKGAAAIRRRTNIMQYRELAPIAPLADAVKCIWTLEGDAAPGGCPQAVLPDGRPELVVHLGDPFELVDAGDRAIRQPAFMFAGQLTSQLLLRPTGRVAVVGVRFHPHGAASLLGAPQHEFTGFPLGLDDLQPALQRDLAIVEPFGADLPRAAAAVQHALIKWVNPARLDARIRFAVEAIGRVHGRLSIDRLSAAAGITRRHLERRFLDHVGITPKRLARIARFQQALHILERDDVEQSGAETAATCGYSDQSHFIRDFRRLAGCSPSEHLLRQGELTGFFLEAGLEDSTTCRMPSNAL